MDFAQDLLLGYLFKLVDSLTSQPLNTNKRNIELEIKKIKKGRMFHETIYGLYHFQNCAASSYLERKGVLNRIFQDR